MEKCVCQICICGTHKCGQRLVKDVLGQYFTDTTLPKSETKASYRAYDHQESASMIRPLAADWNLKPGKIAPPFELCYDNSVDDFAPFATANQSMPAEVEEPMSFGILEPSRKNDASSQTRPIIKPMFLPKREPLHIPPLANATIHKTSYQVPLPMSQLPNCTIKRRYEPPEFSLESQSITMRDYLKWDLNCGLRAPNPRTGTFIYEPPEGNLKIYQIPMEYLTTFREGYGIPPFDIAAIKFGLKKTSNGTNLTKSKSKCERHAEPGEMFFNRAIFTSSYQAAFGPPCMHIMGPCQHRKTESQVDSEKCPAFALNYCYPSNNYEFLMTCCGHDIFLDKNVEVQ